VTRRSLVSADRDGCGSALVRAEQYSNNPLEADHGRLKSRLMRMRGLKRLRSTQTLAADHASGQNPRNGHYEIATDE
jgi:transposase, IS6 family